MRDDRERLQDILEAIERIDRHAPASRRAFERDELVQTWVIHHLEIVGEAARSISEALRARYPDVPWREMAALRSVLAHGYFGIDVDRVWTTVERDLPPLERRVREILDGWAEDAAGA